MSLTNSFHYLEEQNKEVEIWNCLLWYALYEKPPVTIEPCKLVHWMFLTLMGNNKQNVVMVCSTGLQVYPPHIKSLVDHGSDKFYS
jgi:hypothetical protein